MTAHGIRANMVAFAAAALVFCALQAVLGQPRHRHHVAAYTLAGIAPASDAQARAVRDSLLRHLRNAGMHRPGAGRAIEVDVVLEADDPVDGKLPMRVRWIVYEGGKKLGTITQSNDIPADMDPWHAIAVGAAPWAVRGIKKLVTSR